MTTSIKIKFRESTVQGKAGTIFYQVIHKRKMARINTNIRVFPHEWILLSHNEILPGGMLPLIQERIDNDTAQVENIIKDCENSGEDYSAQTIVMLYKKYLATITHTAEKKEQSALAPESPFFAFMHQRIRELKEEQRFSTASNYIHTLNSLKTFATQNQASFLTVTHTLMAQYEAWLKKKGLKRNSTSFYMRTIRAAYNKAVKRGVEPKTDPFRTIYTGTDKTKKRATKEENILALSHLDLSSISSLQLAKDLFLFSFATCGMPFVDMAHLKLENVRDGYIIYERHKTGEPICVKINKVIESIIQKYKKQDSHYIFPLLRDNDPEKIYKQYRTALTTYNRRLHTISNMLPTDKPLTSYVARHSWATIARNHGFPTSAIGKALGHTSEKTTRIYLDAINNEVIDNMNNEILRKLTKSISPGWR